MRKNSKSLNSGLTIEKIEKQKEVLQAEMEKLEQTKQQLYARTLTISGAIQQCDVFINLIEDSGASPVSSIPSEENAEALSEAYS